MNAIQYNFLFVQLNKRSRIKILDFHCVESNQKKKQYI